jgi:glyoxylase-like metal-dependent hydrolase (beta-lactamase superfamily II)
LRISRRYESIDSERTGTEWSRWVISLCPRLSAKGQGSRVPAYASPPGLGRDTLFQRGDAEGFPGEVPTGADKVLPQLLTTDTIDIEGNELRIIRIGQADTAESTVLHIPSLTAVVTGDLAYNEVHKMTAETGDAERAQWITNLDQVAALDPTLVVAGHKKVDNTDDPKIIGESQQYLRDFSASEVEEITADGIVVRMVERYPG